MGGKKRKLLGCIGRFSEASSLMNGLKRTSSLCLITRINSNKVPFFSAFSRFQKL